MRDQFVKKYLLEQKDAFFKNYTVAINSQDVDAVHDMRVAVKRLNTVIRMLNFNEKANFRLKKCFSPIRFVYKRFGGIRDFQVLSSLLAEYQKKIGADFSVLIHKCELRIQQEINQLLNFVRFFQYHKIKRSFKLIEYNLKDKTSLLLSEKVLEYKEDRDKLIKIFSDKSNDEYNLHEVRKLIKDIGYLMEMSQSEMPDFASELKMYKELGSLLGTWHDRDVLYAYLKKEQGKKGPLKVDFEKIVVTIDEEKSDLENKFFSLMA